MLGAGPGGYTAAFRAADLGKKVVLIERYPTLGGVCLNVGCIPSKALLHVAKVITEAGAMASSGVTFGKPKIEIDKLRAWKDGVIGKLTQGLAALARKRKVTVIQGRGEFATPHTLRVETKEGVKTVSFDHCIIAAGSSVARIPGFPYEHPRLIDSTGALALPEVPQRLLVIGGGIIGLEMATVFDALGSRVTVVELLDGLIPGADRDLVRPLAKRIGKRYEKILLKTKVSKIEPAADGLKVSYEGDGAPAPEAFDYVLMAVGRNPNGREIKAEAAGVMVNARGFIPVDRQMRTNVAHIFGIGDIVGEPMLAHKATHEGKLAAEVIAAIKSHSTRAPFRRSPMPIEVAWMGAYRDAGRAEASNTTKAVFPWAASGRAVATGRDEGLTKLLFDRFEAHHRCRHGGRERRRADRGTVLASKWAPMRRTSVSPSIRIRRCQKRCSLRPRLPRDRLPISTCRKNKLATVATRERLRGLTDDCYCNPLARATITVPSRLSTSTSYCRVGSASSTPCWPWAFSSFLGHTRNPRIGTPRSIASCTLAWWRAPVLLCRSLSSHRV